MSNELVFMILFLLMSVGVSIILVNTAKTISHKITVAENYVASTALWPVVTGTVLELGLNLDYEWPDGQNPRDGMLKNEIEVHRNDFYENSIFHGTLIRYRFSASGTEFISRNIQVIPLHEHSALVYKLNIGDKIPVRYNPQNPEECFIKKSSKADLKEYGWRLLQDLAPTLAFMLASSVMFFVLLTIVLSKNN